MPARSRALLAAGVALVATLGACGGAAPETTPTAALTAGPTDGAADAFPVTIEHALGTTVVESAPERVVTIGWASQDTALALGVAPVGVPVDEWAGDPRTGLLPWTAAAFDALGADAPSTYVDLPEVDVEEIAALDPDLILATYSGISQEVYDQLSAFAPVVAYPERPWLVSWQDQTLINGRALGLAAEAEALVEEMEQTLARTAADNPSLAGVTFAYVYTNMDGTLSVYVAGDPRVDLLTGLGMELAPGVAALEVPEGSFFVNLGTENADVLADADVVVTWFNDPTEQAAVEAMGTFAAIPAVASGHYLPLLDRVLGMAMGTNTALSLPWGLDAFVPQLVAAVGD